MIDLLIEAKNKLDELTSKSFISTPGEIEKVRFKCLPFDYRIKTPSYVKHLGKKHILQEEIHGKKIILITYKFRAYWYLDKLFHLTPDLVLPYFEKVKVEKFEGDDRNFKVNFWCRDIPINPKGHSYLLNSVIS